MTSAHIFFIPGMIIIGMFFGFIFGARAARNQLDMQRKRDEEREVARAERAARRGANGASKVDDRPPAEASESKIDENPAPSEAPVAEAKPKQPEGGKDRGGNKGGGKGKRAS